MARDWDLRADTLAQQAYDEGRPTAWFEHLYAEGESGAISMPWDRDAPQALLAEWTEQQRLDGRGARAVVVGCGLGADAEHLARLGFATTAFDISPTAVRAARSRHPDSSVDYQVSDLLDPPAAWRHAFDLVVEIYTLQALPDPPRADAAASVADLVAPGGRLLAIAFRNTGEPPDQGPPFPLTRSAMEGLATGGLRLAALEELPGEKWRAELHR